jgi:uncharacterized membrane protein YfcA
MSYLFFLKKHLPEIAIIAVTIAIIGMSAFASASEGTFTAVIAAQSMPWWGWPLVLFVTSFLIGAVAVLGGIGGTSLFVTVIGAFFPFHVDFVRGAGVMIALVSALMAGPVLLRKRLADIRIALPAGLVTSSASIAGALAGIAMPLHMVQSGLGILAFAIIGSLLFTKKEEFPDTRRTDSLSTALGIKGKYQDISLGYDINWRINRTPHGLAIFAFIGFLAGMFGIGARWANVPLLNLVMGAPLKVSVATSKFLLSITDSSAAWIYLNNGLLLPIIIVPATLGITFGSIAGVKISMFARPTFARYLVMALLLLSGLKLLLTGLWGWK